MNVLITGGAGQVGTYAVQRLLDSHHVTILDRRPSAHFPQVPLLNVDLLNREEVLRAVQGFDVVVHLAAIPNPYHDPGDVVLAANVTTTYNVLEAVKQNRIRRVVYGCSESASGFGIHEVNHRPEYLPIDEEHPSWPHESYSLSKYIGERLCQEYSRAFGIECISLRYGWVWLEICRAAAEGIIAQNGADEGGWFGAHVFPEDVAQAIALAVGYTLPPAAPAFDVFYITAAETFSRYPSLELARRLFGTLPPVRKPEYFAANPRASLFDITRARERLGYRPEFSWKDLNSPRRATF
jgi:UDP-glucose 4-epimerase